MHKCHLLLLFDAQIDYDTLDIENILLIRHVFYIVIIVDLA